MKKLIRGSFEQLEELGKTTAKQAAQQPKKMVEEAASAVTGKKTEIEKGRPSGGLPFKKGKSNKRVKPKLTQAQIAEKIEKAAQSRAKLHLEKLEEEIGEIKKQRLEQIKKVQEEAFQEEEKEKLQEAQLPSKRKKGLLPISVKRLKQKVEGWRGAKG